MRTALSTIIALLCLAAAATAQTSTCVQTDPTATPVGTLSVSFTFSNVATVVSDTAGGTGTASTDGGNGKGKGNGGGIDGDSRNTGQVTFEGLVWKVGVAQEPAISITAGAVVITGDRKTIVSRSTPEIFNMIAERSIAQGIIEGKITCGSGCTTVRVSQPACVNRRDGGQQTTFEACGSDCCTRVYEVCCVSGQATPVITLVTSQSTGCISLGGSNGCESTCP